MHGTDSLPSFETRPSAAPQDEVTIAGEAAEPHPGSPTAIRPSPCREGCCAVTSLAKSPAGLRPLLLSDTPLLAEIFRASIAELTTDDYSEAQQAAWMASAGDEAAFGARLAGELTLVATIDGAAVGFAALKGADVIDMLYVHPAVAGQGIGAQLCDALEKLAAARGATKLAADASDTALGFFTRRGFVPQRRNSVPRDDEWLANTTVQKTLSAAHGTTP